MKRKVFTYVALIVFFGVLVNVAALAQHEHHGQDGQSQPADTFRASTEKPFPALMDEAMTVMHKGMDQAPKTEDQCRSNP